MREIEAKAREEAALEAQKMILEQTNLKNKALEAAALAFEEKRIEAALSASAIQQQLLLEAKAFQSQARLVADKAFNEMRIQIR